jgi:FkbM family methyltransferase
MLMFLFKVLKKLGLKNAFNFFIPVIINDSHLTIPVLGQLGKGNLSPREVWMFELLSKIIHFKNGSFIDVGINIGQTLIHFKSLKNDMPYIGFEPNPTCIYYTQQLIKYNKWTNCTVIPCAIFHSNELTPINYYSIGTDSMASLVNNFREDRKVVKSEVVAGYNNFVVGTILKGNEIAYLKLDVEGFEYDVIIELQSQIVTDRPFVIAEFLPPNTSNYISQNGKINKTFEFFDGIDYSSFRVIKNKKNRIEELQKVIDPLDGLTRNTADHLFCPNEFLNLLSLQFVIV